MYVTDPRTGIAGRLKWLPSIAEVREACETQARAIYDRRNAEARRADQLATRAVVIGPDRAAVMSRMRADFPDVFEAEFSAEFKQAAAAENRRTLAELCANNGVSIDALPDRKGEAGSSFSALGKSAPDVHGPAALGAAARAAIGVGAADGKPPADA